MRAWIFSLGCLLFVTMTPVQASALDLVCEMGKRVTVQGNQQTDDAIGLRWQGRLYRLLRVATSTGANRFEDRDNGLVWISIPSKAMLLDSRRGEPLVNECKARSGNASGRPVR